MLSNEQTKNCEYCKDRIIHIQPSLFVRRRFCSVRCAGRSRTAKRDNDPLCTQCNRPKHNGKWKPNLCARHARFTQMRDTALSRNVYVPTTQELEAIAGNDEFLSCPTCGVVMHWMVAEKRSLRPSLITLQHDRNGQIRFLCFSCNARHYDFDGDEFYLYGPHFKPCKRCRAVLPRECLRKGANLCGPCSKRYDSWYSNERRRNTNAVA